MRKRLFDLGSPLRSRGVAARDGAGRSGDGEDHARHRSARPPIVDASFHVSAPGRRRRSPTPRLHHGHVLKAAAPGLPHPRAAERRPGSIRAWSSRPWPGDRIAPRPARRQSSHPSTPHRGGARAKHVVKKGSPPVFSPAAQRVHEPPQARHDTGRRLTASLASVGLACYLPVCCGVHTICNNVRMPQQPEPQIIRGHCPNCGSDRKALVRCKHVVHSTDEDDGTLASDTGMILECCGCERVYFRRDRWFSEWETIGEHPITGEPRLEGGTETVYWPPPVSRRRPNWLHRIQESERDLGKLLEELYAALDNDLRVLAAVAVRTVFDRASELLQVDPAIKFDEKLKNLQAAGK